MKSSVSEENTTAPQLASCVLKYLQNISVQFAWIPIEWQDMNRIALSEQDKANYKAVSLFVAVGATMICEMWMFFASFFFALNWLVC